MTDPAERAAERIKREEQGPNYRCVFVPRDRMVAIIREEFQKKCPYECICICGEPLGTCEKSDDD